MQRTTAYFMAAFFLAITPIAWAGRGVPTEVTPEKISDQGFSIEFRFRDNTIKEGTKPTRRTGVIQVQLIFDKDKGPSIKKMDAASLVVRDGDEAILAVPLEWPGGENPGFIQFSMHERMLPNASIILTSKADQNAASFTIPLQKFRPAP